MARGGRRPGAGRPKGKPNKVTSAQREAFLQSFRVLQGDLERWIRETGDGFTAVHFLADGTQIPYTEKNPAKAADILTRMAEFHFPKLGRQEIAGPDGGPVPIVIRDLGKETP